MTQHFSPGGLHCICPTELARCALPSPQHEQISDLFMSNHSVTLQVLMHVHLFCRTRQNIQERQHIQCVQSWGTCHMAEHVLTYT